MYSKTVKSFVFVKQIEIANFIFPRASNKCNSILYLKRLQRFQILSNIFILVEILLSVVA